MTYADPEVIGAHLAATAARQRNPFSEASEILEQAIIGVAVADPGTISALSQLRPEDFREGEGGLHGRMWAHILEDHGAGREPAPPALRVRFQEGFSALGESDYLEHMIRSAPFSAQVPALVEQFTANAVRREIMRGAARPGASIGEVTQAVERAARCLATMGAGTRPFTATPFEWTAPATMPAREWLYGRHLIRGFLSATFAPGGVGKSSLTVTEALAMATGRPLLGDRIKTPLRIWLYGGEDPLDETRRRVVATMAQFGIKAADLGGRLFVDSGRDSPLSIALSGRGGVEINTACVQRLETAIRDRGIDVVIIDPFVSVHSVEENNNGAIQAVSRQFAGIADRAGCAFDLVHHVRKSTGGGETTVEDGRGAGALLAAVRSARTLNTMSEKEAEGFGVPNRRSCFRVDNGKSNLAPPSDAAHWRRLVSVDLENGPEGESDLVGVVVAWEPPDAFDGIKPQDTLRVQQAISGGSYRFDPQSAEWVGRAVAEVLGLDLESSAEKARVKKLLKTWFSAGVVRTVDREDSGRRVRKFVEAGAWVEA